MDDLRILLERVDTQLARLELPAAELLQPGLSVAQIEEHVRNLPFRLPHEVYALYQWHDGMPANRDDIALFPGEGSGWVFMSLEDAIAGYNSHIAVAQKYGGDMWQHLWHPDWFPILESDVPTSLCVLGQHCDTELAPLLYVDVEGGSNDQEYTSLTQLVRVVAECYETGAYFVTADGTLEADAAQVGAIRRREERSRADAAIAVLQRGRADPDYPRALDDAVTFHDSRAVEPLLQVLQESGFTDTGAIVALAELGGERVVEPLFQVVREGPVMDATFSSMEATWAEAQHYLDREGSARSAARATAIQSLMLIAEQRKLQLPAAPFAVALYDPLTYVRQRAIWALERIGTTEARDALLAATHDPDTQVRLVAEQALERLRSHG